MKAAIIILLASRAAFAGAGASSMPSLEVDASARAMALGGAYTAVGDDSVSLFYNPAGIARLPRSDVSLTHTEWISGIKSEYGSAAFPVGNDVTLGCALNLFTISPMDRTDASGNTTGSFGAGESSFMAAAAKNIGLNFAVGAAVKYMRQSVDDAVASGSAIDLGVMGFFGHLRLGAALQNVGPGMAVGDMTFSLPLTKRVGASLKLGEYLMAVGDYVESSSASGARAGLEYAVRNSFSQWDRLLLRAGWQAEGAGSSGSTGQFALGAGYERPNWRVDYGFAPCGDLGNAQRISFMYRFGDLRNTSRSSPSKIKKAGKWMMSDEYDLEDE
ncbi:MAG: PorV/PorQ family protein [Elusimicrobiales bacterium]